MVVVGVVFEFENRILQYPPLSPPPPAAFDSSSDGANGEVALEDVPEVDVEDEADEDLDGFVA